jgi:amino acid adenylation domain-containing protein
MMTENKIDKRNVEDIMGLTSLQEGMLFHYLSNPGSKQYFEQFRLQLSGEMNVECFKQAWQTVAQTNEILRAVIRWEQLEEPLQVILKQKELPIRVIDLRQQDDRQLPGQIDKILQQDQNQTIDITREPLRITLCRIDEDKSEMILTFHHILYDGWSQGIILSEFLEAYQRLLKGEPPVQHQKTRFKEFFKWFQSLDRHRQEESWEKLLQGFDTRTLLPYDKNKLGEIARVKIHSFTLPSTIKDQLDRCSQEQNITLSTILYAAWGILLQKYNNSNDIIFGTTVSGRTPEIKGIESMVGLFINTLPMRLQTSPNNTAAEVFQSLGSQLEERNQYGCEHSSLTRIKQMTGIGRDSNLFDSLVVIDNYPLDNLVNRPGDLALRISSYDMFEMTNFDLTLQILLLEAGRMRIDFRFNADLFEEKTIQLMACHYQNTLEGITLDPRVEISGVQMLSREEIRRILEEFNTPAIALQVDKTIQGEIEARAARTPQNKAVSFEDQWITYRELDERANQLARLLGEYGVAEGSRIALMFPRSIDMIIAFLAILKAGAACIPLDISHPWERSGFIIRDSEAGFILTAGEPGIDFQQADRTCSAVQIVYDPEKIKAFPSGNLEKSVQSQDLSYIIYTSGSTGKPKGALLHHSGVVNHTYTKIEVLGITEKDVVANNFSINVIAAVWQILSPLFTGARLKVYSDEIEWDPYRQFEQAAADGVTVIEVIPSVLKAYLFVLDEGKVQVKLENLRKIALTTEETKPFLVNKFYERYRHIDLVDCYGQTECCDDVLHYTIPHDTDTQKVPIGTPSLNTNVFILNHHQQLQPVGVPGEITVIGAGVAYGYWKRLEMTAEKFGHGLKGYSDYHHGNHRSHKSYTSYILYKTGDLGRWLPDGKIEYLGRVDHQVKIRGNRVELREIENQMMGYSIIKEAAVVAKEDKEGDKSLYAFFISDEEVTVGDLRQYLSKYLPDYMIPAHFIRMEQLPLTPNGKIDRKALVKAEIKGDIATGTEYKPPRSEFEKKIQEIWSQLLEKDKEQIGINDNFFDLGGHSLLLIKLKSKLEKTFETNLKQEIPIVELFNHPTIAHQAQYIEENIKVKGEQKIPKDFHKAAQDTREPSPNKSFYGGSRGAVFSKRAPLVAVIGISLRIPEAANIDEFWQNLITGTESISFFNEEELEGSAAYRMIQGNSKLIPAGGVLGGIDLFDADFFGYTPREAEIMDPQQRLFLEYAWMALEDAGYVGKTYPGAVGVYAGVGWNTYILNHVLANPGVINAMGEFQIMIGNDKDFLSTRVSYKLNLKGPALTVQSACSTSLVAIHLARQGLLNGDCDMALAGGVVARLPEKAGYFYTPGGHLSPDGHCRAFDAEAGGTVFSNGIGIALLKRLDEALEDRDHIYAVIKGSAINNDGSLKVGYTSPSEIQQSQVISAALTDAGVEPASIGYIETHGTGTRLGDPVELSALTRAFRTKDNGNTNYPANENQYCAIGSIKSNVGHLDAAAGIIGFLKVVLCLEHKQIPPSIHFEHANPMIDFSDSPFYVNHTLKDWPESKTKTLRRAGVSSLGIGGTNAHVILEEAPGGTRGLAPLSNAQYSRPYQLFLLSAKTESVLEEMSRRLANHLNRHPGINLADVAYTLQVGRDRFEHRKMFLCPGSDVNEACAALSTPEKLKSFSAKIEEKPVIFMFPGQGSQYINMGLELYRTENIFREEMDRCFDILKPLLDYDLKEILYPANGGGGDHKSSINQTEIAQPLLFIFEYALAKLLIKWGVKPYAMIGHSIGEYVAACLSGVLSLEHALKLVAVRGQLMQKMPPGTMLSVSLSEKEIVPLLEPFKQLALAAVNSTTLCVISGPGEDIQRFEELLKEKQYDCSRLHTSHAFHSSMMDPILKPFTEKSNEVQSNNPEIPYISNVTGDWLSSREVTSPEYWGNHLRSTVRFADGMEKLLGIESAVFIEIGPGKALSTFVRAHAHKKKDQFVIQSVRHPKKNISDVYFLLENIGGLWLYGVNTDWDEFYQGQGRHRIPLPTYPFARKKYCLETKDIGMPQEIQQTKRKIEDWFYMPAWTLTAPASSNVVVNAEGVKVNENEKECWLFFLDDDVNSDRPGIGHQLIQQLNKDENRENIDIIGVKIGKQFEKRSQNGVVEYAIHPGQYEDYIALLEDLQNRDKTINKIVHSWTLSTTSSFGGLELGVYSLLYLVKAMGSQFMFNRLDLRVISRGLHIIESGDNCIPENAALLGPCNVIPQEYPNITCRSIDIKGDRLVGHLVSELKALPQERTTAYRGDHRWVQIFTPIKPPKAVGVPHRLREHGVYLIAGGLGNIGLIIAQYLAQSVQAKLILTAEFEFPGRDRWEHLKESHDDFISGKIMSLKKLEEMGAEVLVLRADITDKKQMERAITEVENRFGTLHGVIHAAGLMEGSYFKTISDSDNENCQVHFKPKIQGLYVLDEVLKNKELDFCMLNSSLSSILGGLTLYAYSAANSFMDAFARRQNQVQKKWLAINWDEWKKDKHKTKKPEHPALGGTPSGLNITPEEGKEALNRVLFLNKIPQIIVSTGDLQRRLQQWVFAEPESQEDKSQKKIDDRLIHKRPNVQSIYEAPQNEAEKIIVEIWQELLGIDSIGVLDNFFELGGHSLLATKLVSRLREIFRIDLPLDILFDKPTIRELLDNIVNIWGDGEAVEEIAKTYREVQLLT